MREENDIMYISKQVANEPDRRARNGKEIEIINGEREGTDSTTGPDGDYFGGQVGKILYDDDLAGWRWRAIRQEALMYLFS